MGAPRKDDLAGLRSGHRAQRLTTRRLTRAAALAVALVLAACGTIDRTSPDSVPRPLAVAGDHDPRIRTSDPARLAALVGDMERRVIRADRPQTILALSGGGANGAYGAGLLYGWSEAGDRPEFDIVTGVSTGALAAPFAFLGPDWDDQLLLAFVGGEAEQLLQPHGLPFLRQPSLLSDRGLRELVGRYVTPELLAAIAAEHAQGRRLLVGTTNLDTQETVIWDMGALATEGGDDALALFRDVLVASASIPGVFPPVMIPATQADGEVVLEMHVDGGVNAPFLAIPEDLLMWTSPVPPVHEGRLYVVVNGQAGRDSDLTEGDIQGILSRAYDSMSRASVRVHLAATAAFADRNGMSMSVSAIPDNLSASSLSFDMASMLNRFAEGRARAHEGAWTPFAPLSESPASALGDLLDRDATGPGAERP